VKRGEHGRRIASALPFGELADQPPAWGSGSNTAIVFWLAGWLAGCRRAGAAGADL